jgi:hypothetical protein
VAKNWPKVSAWVVTERCRAPNHIAMAADGLPSSLHSAGYVSELTRRTVSLVSISTSIFNQTNLRLMTGQPSASSGCSGCFPRLNAGTCRHLQTRAPPAGVSSPRRKMFPGGVYVAVMHRSTDSTSCFRVLFPSPVSESCDTFRPTLWHHAQQEQTWEV